jgi:hypothetical protein
VRKYGMLLLAALVLLPVELVCVGVVFTMLFVLARRYIFA